ncbi:MAG TPA: hypothetical protein VM554_15545 [Acidisarcina sp.]|nr:hypothetical protein [Acidisarcina sp.]
MIGFGVQRVVRRPIYSVTGQKLCYYIDGPRGIELLTLRGKKYAKLTAKHVEWIASLSAGSSACGGTILSNNDIYED